MTTYIKGCNLVGGNLCNICYINVDKIITIDSENTMLKDGIEYYIVTIDLVDKIGRYAVQKTHLYDLQNENLIRYY